MHSFKKIISIVLSLTMIFAIAIPAAADAITVEPGIKRVTVGADLTDEQILSVYNDFQIVRGSVTELKVTNAEERQYLEGLVSESTIGSRSISCVYIETLEKGNGLEVSTNNISWCTNSIYTNALITAGIYDAKVIVSAPFEVSGTAALTGIYKAFEDITGQEISEDAKDAGTLEMVVTSELADAVGDEQATEIVNDLKSILDETGDMTDEELNEEVEKIADDHEVTLTDEQIDKLMELVRSLEKLDISAIMDQVDQLKDKLDELSGESKGFFAKIWDGIKNFFKSIGEFFSNLFGGGDDKDESDVNISDTNSENVGATDISNEGNSDDDSDNSANGTLDSSSDIPVNSDVSDNDNNDDNSTSSYDIGGDIDETAPADITNPNFR